MTRLATRMPCLIQPQLSSCTRQEFQWEGQDEHHASGPALQPADACEKSRLHRRGRHHPCSRHRRQHRHLLAALLVATGLYGTLAYRVSRRTPEVGVRMALGARPQQVLWMILRESLRVSVAGVLLGLPLAFVGARLLRSLLFGLAPEDPLS